jgi:hypothetical protein
MRPRVVLAALASLALVTAGCAGTPTDEPTTTPTGRSAGSASPSPTGPPSGTVDFPDGPKSAPTRPPTLNESSVREYVRAHEYRYAYNSLWMGEYTEVTLDCRVDGVTRRAWGYEAVVTCTGYSNTDVPENSTATPGPHADWFTQSFRYRVSADATERVRVENRDPV